ncbi:MAG: hypothetical protein HOO86_14235 [Bacteroidales bacterium]|nr:hypothetical protein [Bacteroidales bacterium]
MKKFSILIIISLIAFQANTQNWLELNKIVASDRSPKANFGYSSSLSGNYVIISAPGEGTFDNPYYDEGAAYIFEKGVDDSWFEAAVIVASDRDTNNWFGEMVSISGDYAIVGAQLADEDEHGEHYKQWAGAAYIYERDHGGNWIEVQKIAASDRAEFARFGSSVSIYGNYAIVGAYFENKDASGNSVGSAGAAYIYRRNENGVWVETQKIVASDRQESDNFGFSVSIHDKILIVGALHDNMDEEGENSLDDAGSAYVFEKDNSGNWTQKQKLVDLHREKRAEFGNAVSIYENSVIVGARYANVDPNGWNPLENAGSVCFFERQNNGNWMLVFKACAFDRLIGDDYGTSVDIHNNYAIVGVPGNCLNEDGVKYVPKAGAAYIYYKESNTGNWLFGRKIVASKRSMINNLGISVTIEDNYALAGANNVNTDAIDADSLESAGAVYFFKPDFSSISENDFGSKIKLSPNPTNEAVSIDLGKFCTKVHIKILNNHGQSISSKSFENMQTAHLKIDGPVGLYFLMIFPDEGKSACVKVIKY